MNKLLGPIPALLVVAFAPLAQADIQISYTIDGGSTVTCGPVLGPGAIVACPNAVLPMSLVNLGASSNSPGTAPNGNELSSTTDLNNTTAVDHTIVINIASDGFTAPVTPPDITFFSHIGGTVVIGEASNKLSYQSCIGGNNLTTSCPVGTSDLNSGISAPNIVPSGSFSNDQTGLITSLTGPFSINEQLTVTLDPGAQINFAASTLLTPVPVPEPVSIALLGIVLFFTVGSIRRKRNQASQV